MSVCAWCELCMYNEGQNVWINARPRVVQVGVADVVHRMYAAYMTGVNAGSEERSM
jgi:hypothetical protein